MSFGKKFFSNKISYLSRNCYVLTVQLIFIKQSFFIYFMLKNRIVFFMLNSF